MSSIIIEEVELENLLVLSVDKKKDDDFLGPKDEDNGEDDDLDLDDDDDADDDEEDVEDEDAPSDEGGDV